MLIMNGQMCRLSACCGRTIQPLQPEHDDHVRIAQRIRGQIECVRYAWTRSDRAGEREKRNAGIHEVKFDGSHLASGVYFYRLTAGDFVQSKRLTILK